jgi:hypothetical protein
VAGIRPDAGGWIDADLVPTLRRHDRGE